MRISAPFKPSSRCIRLVTIGVFGFALAGCGNDVTRFNDDPTGNPFRSQSSNDITNSSAPRQYSSAPSAQIESRPLNQPAYGSGGTPVYGPKVYGQNSAPATQPYQSSYQPRQQASYQPKPSYQPRQQASYQPKPSNQPRYSPAPAYSPSRESAAAASPRGRVTVKVKSGETLYSIASRYNVPVRTVMQENRLADASHVRAGQTLVIPATAQASSTPPAQVTRTASISAPARQAEAPAAAPRKEAVKAPAPAAETRVDNVASVKPVETEPLNTRTASNSAPTFRWPVKGRVISNFGTKPNGQQNDGINISVPENTAVKAAEDGVVAYAGNELKGYGNLVLVRHAGGWVTAYAHNSEVLVHRGETVKRGQVIAKAGQTGGVASPQVHFEIRKGSNPVDPVRHLSSL